MTVVPPDGKRVTAPMTRRQRRFLHGLGEHARTHPPGTFYQPPPPRRGELRVVMGLATRGFVRSYSQEFEITTWPRDLLITSAGREALTKEIK